MCMEIISLAEKKTLLASDLCKRTFSWDKDDFGLNSLLSLRRTKATFAKRVHTGRLQARRNILVLQQERHCVGRKPSVVGTRGAQAWRNRLYLSN